MTTTGFFQLLFVIAIVSVVLYYALILWLKTSSVKIILFGIALLIFSDSVLKGSSGTDLLVSIIGLSFCIDGFIKKDSTK